MAFPWNSSLQRLLRDVHLSANHDSIRSPRSIPLRLHHRPPLNGLAIHMESGDEQNCLNIEQLNAFSLSLPEHDSILQLDQLSRIQLINTWTVVRFLFVFICSGGIKFSDLTAAEGKCSFIAHSTLILCSFMRFSAIDIH